MTKVLIKLGKLQEAWQSQCDKRIDVNPDQMLMAARLERKVYFWCDVGLIAFFLILMVYFAWPANRNFHKDWPWLISAASGAWVAGFILFDRWSQRRRTAQYDDSVLAHVERSIRDIEHRIWLDRFNLWWYTLPIALGCMIPPVIFFAMEIAKRPLVESLMPLLITESVFGAIFYFVYWSMKRAAHIGIEGRRKQLQAFQALRVSLLNEELDK